MKKCILPLLLVLFLCPLHAFAAELDTTAACSLTLCYQTDGKAFSSVPVDIYRVAEARPDGTFELMEPYASYPVNIHDITRQSQWKTVAATLRAYILANQVPPTRTEQTDGQGTVTFSGLETGLYLVDAVLTEDADGVYTFAEFMIYVPTPQPDGTYDYAVEANPKGASIIPKTQYTVTKLWRDSGADRPAEITVDIYLDGKLVDTQILGPENNWTYTWSVTGETLGKWTVVERQTPEGYRVTIHEKDGVFTIINSSLTLPEPPPDTGDTFSPVLWITVLCVSGMLLLVLGVYARRRA